jgi:hypothetical protein
VANVATADSIPMIHLALRLLVCGYGCGCVQQVKQSRDASVRLLATCFRDLLRRPSTPNDLASALYLTASQVILRGLRAVTV